MNLYWLKRIDFLNIPTSLSYKNEYFYATYIGGILTIIFIIIIMVITSYQIIILNTKSSFKLISNQYTDLSQVIDFSETPFLFQMINDKGKVIEMDEKLFEMKAYNMEQTIRVYDNGTRRRKVTNTILELERCDKIFTNESEYYSELNLSRYICIKPGQNLTAFGLLGDMAKPYKGIRIYINKCSGSECYDDDTIAKKFHNAKFFITYLSLSSNMFTLKGDNIKYQLFTKFCSLSTNILKKIVFTFDIGRFYLYNNILFKNKISFNYMLGNDYSIDVDLDPTSTLKSSEYTIAYISFHFGGNVIETRKEVQTIFESLSIIGNIFNIILTIFKVVNSYYANKVLFVDIFKNVFFAKKIIFNIKDNLHLKNYLNNNKKNSICKNKNCDLSEQIYFNNDANKKNSIKSINKKPISRNSKNSSTKKRSKVDIENKGNFTKNKLLYYYLLPFWVLRRNRTINSIYSIKDKICGYFSIEKINELIKFKEALENKSIKSKMINNEIININGSIDGSIKKTSGLIDIDDKNIKIVK